MSVEESRLFIELLEMPRVVHFEIDANKPEQLLKFYENVFDWKSMKWEGPEDYWLITTGKEDEAGIDGGLVKRTKPESSTVNTIDVPSIDEYIKKVRNNRGIIVTPKHAVPGVGWAAYFKDPEGNMFGMMERDESAR
jgi:predicted enzyme related to lactoylglutathione lyase